MPKTFKSLALVSLLTAAAGANAAALDLSGWSPLTLTYTGGQPAGNWVLESGNTAVKQTVNADPSFYLLNPCCLQRIPAPRAPAHDFSAA